MTKTLMYKSKIVAEVFIADSFMNRFLGYMLRKKPHHEAILFKPCNSIHTFFMRFPIDVLFLNEEFRVIKKVEALQPRKVVMPQKDASIVIEGYTGMFKNIEEGGILKIQA